MANLSQMRREKMVSFLEMLKEQHTDDESLIAINQIEKELTSKKYGLVWEEHEEEIDVKMQTHIPVFAEDQSREIVGDTENNVYNFLLEGDNLHSLKLLEKTHKGKIDIIYIDPPYNTGNKDFIYGDEYVGSEDAYKHSKWISFMYSRLVLAKRLLSNTGAIFISIDDNEYANLKLVCDEIFGESNLICNICRQAIKGGSRAINIKTVHDYVLVYAKAIDKLNPFTGEEKEALVLDLEDKKGKYARGRELNKWGAGSRREDSPTMWFPITGPNGEDVYPIRNDGSEGRWRWGKKKLLDAVKEDDVIFEKRENGTYVVYEKVREQKNSTLQYTTWFSDNYINAKGSEAVKKVFNTMMSVFSYAKPVELIKDICFMCNKKDAIVLDFFAGSGTTGQAVLELNQEDGGNRKFILCTNNDNSICEEVTYTRLVTIITGKRRDGSGYSEGAPANLKYYKTDFVKKDSEELYEDLLEHIVEMIQLQYGVKVDNEKYIIIMDDEEMDEFEQNIEKYDDLQAVFINQDVLLSSSQERMLQGINTFIIPDCYFDFELREAGELW